jgi:hypothetical protein
LSWRAWAVMGSVGLLSCSFLADYADVFDGDCTPTLTAPPQGSNLCESISEFSGTQIVDGVNTEFCGLTETLFSIIDGGGKNMTPFPPSVNATAGIWEGWSNEGLHVFVHVTENPVSPPLPDADTPFYFGDAVEIFAAGPTAKLDSGDYVDAGGDRGPTLITIGAPSVAGDFRWTAEGARGTASPDSGQYAARQVPDGYDVEAFIPWSVLEPDASAPQGGEKMSVDIGVVQRIGLQGFKSFYSYTSHVEKVPYCLMEGGDKPSCDDLTWCRTTLHP